MSKLTQIYGQKNGKTLSMQIRLGLPLNDKTFSEINIQAENFAMNDMKLFGNGSKTQVFALKFFLEIILV